MKYSPETSAAVECAKRSLDRIARSRSAVEAAGALDDVGVELIRCMERIGPEASLIRAATSRSKGRTHDAR